jgi:methionyl-tRNA formyltransferase
VRVVILSPVDTSPFTRLVAKFCVDEPGIELAGIVVRKILNPARLRSELKRDGIRLVRKAWKKLVLGGDVRDSSAGERGFFELTVERGLEGTTASAFASEHDVPVAKVSDHNDAESIEFLKRADPEIVAFTGGGIIRQPLLEAAGRGIFNTHMGLLPPYRGNDVVEWPIVEDQADLVGLGVTLHFMARGIDTGPIALTRRVPIEPGDTMERLRKRFEPAMLAIMEEGLRAVRDDRLELRDQAITEGRQYFIMHPRFYDIARRKLAELAAR